MLSVRPDIYRPQPLATPDSPLHERSGRPRNEIRTRYATERPDFSRIDATSDQLTIQTYVGDEAGFKGESPVMYTMKPGSGAAEVAFVMGKAVSLKTDGEVRGIVAFGAKSSLTGAAVPHNDVLINMQELTGIGEVETTLHGEKVVTVEPGVTFSDLNKKLKQEDLFLPCAPTYDRATVGGGASTNNGGALNYKYGKLNEFVEGIEMVLATGEIINVKRGESFSQKGEKEGDPDYFEIVSPDGTSRRKVPVPTYAMPDVPKISAGYNTKRNEKGEVDLIDMLVGSEGTLGTITKLSLRVLPEPPTAMALVVCDNDQQMHELVRRLRQQQPEKRETKEPGGLSAVEYIGSGARQLIAENGSFNPPGEKGNALVLVQMELPGEDMTALELLGDNITAVGINVNDDSRVLGAIPEDKQTQQYFIGIREDVPDTVNRIMRGRGIKKSGTDVCVNPDDLEKLSGWYETALGDIQSVEWGHGEGNGHRNAMPKTQEEATAAASILLQVSTRAIRELGGVGTAEHAVGEHPVKQALLRELVGDKGIAEMRAFKEAFDPHGVMAPGNIFPVLEAA